VSRLSSLSAIARASDNQDAHDPLLIGGDDGQVGWQTDRDPGDIGADGFAERSLARHCSATTCR
jgi:hypothetical protein